MPKPIAKLPTVMLFGKIPVSNNTEVGWVVPYKVLDPYKQRSERGTESQFNLVRTTVIGNALPNGQIELKTSRQSEFKPFNFSYKGSVEGAEAALAKWEAELHSLEKRNLLGVRGNDRGYDFQPAYNDNEP